MKKFMIGASALAMMLSLNSCSSDDSGGGTSESKLLGKWEYQTTKLSGGGATAGEQPYEGNQEGCSKDFIEIKEDGVLVDGDYYNSECSLDSSPGTWTLDGKEVTVTVNGETQTYTVVSNSGSTLKVKQTYQFGGVNIVEQTTFKKASAQ